MIDTTKIDQLIAFLQVNPRLYHQGRWEFEDEPCCIVGHMKNLFGGPDKIGLVKLQADALAYPFLTANEVESSVLGEHYYPHYVKARHAVKILRYLKENPTVYGKELANEWCCIIIEAVTGERPARQVYEDAVV